MPIPVSMELDRPGRLLSVDAAERVLEALVAASAGGSLSLLDPGGLEIASGGASAGELGSHSSPRAPASGAGPATMVATPSVATRVPVVVEGQEIGCLEARHDEGSAEALALADSAAAVLAELASSRSTDAAALDGMADELLDRYEEVALLHELGRAFTSVFDARGLCEIALERTLSAIEAPRGFVALRDGDSARLEVAAVTGGEPAVGTELPLDRGVSGPVAASGRPLLLHDDAAAPQSAGPAQRLGEAVLSVPVTADEGVDDLHPPLGALTLVGARGGRFTAGQAQLAGTIAAQLARALETGHLVASLREAEGLRRELEVAAGIQEGLLPAGAPEVDRATVAGLCVPAASVGGDYYDFLVDDSGRLHVVVADVSGHSIGSALMMATARNVLRHEMAAGGSPGAVVAAANAAMCADLVAAGHFITMFCVRFDPADGRLEYANGGHNLPLLRRAADGGVVELEADGAALGIFDEYPWEERKVALAPGDLVVLYTDGVVEAARAGGEPYGDDRLRGLVEGCGGAAAEELNGRLFDSVQEHAGGGSQDDVTIVTLRVSE